MAISFVAAGTVATGANPTPALPAGYAVGDLFIAIAQGDTIPTNFTATPSGWTQLYNISGSTTSVPAQLIYRIATSLSETAPTFSNTQTTLSAGVVAYRGVNSTPIDVSTTKSETANVSSHTSNTVTTTVANDWIITVYQGETFTTITAPASTTTRFNYNGAGANSSFLIVDEIQTSVGLTTARTSTTSTALQNTIGTIAIKEAITANGNFFFIMGT